MRVLYLTLSLSFIFAASPPFAQYSLSQPQSKLKISTSSKQQKLPDKKPPQDSQGSTRR